MIINQEIQIDLTDPGQRPQIHAKQGDALSRNICVKLTNKGKEWVIFEGTQAVVRYCVQNRDGQIVSRGMYDTLKDGTPAYLISSNGVTVMLTEEITAQDGVATVDVLLANGARKLATFSFEVLVHPAPCPGIAFGDSDQNTHYYRVSSLESINRELETLRSAVTALGGGEYLQ